MERMEGGRGDTGIGIIGQGEMTSGMGETVTDRHDVMNQRTSPSVDTGTSLGETAQQGRLQRRMRTAIVGKDGRSGTMEPTSEVRVGGAIGRHLIARAAETGIVGDRGRLVSSVEACVNIWYVLSGPPLCFLDERGEYCSFRPIWQCPRATL